MDQGKMQTESEMQHGACSLYEGKMGEATSARFCVSEMRFRLAFLLSLLISLKSILKSMFYWCNEYAFCLFQFIFKFRLFEKYNEIENAWIAKFYAVVHFSFLIRENKNPAKCCLAK